MATFTYNIDPSHSRVNFSVKHMMIATVRGAFTALSGSITVDPEDPTTLQFSAEIDATSFDTGNDQRDGHVKGPDFLDVEKYPTLTFSGSGAKKVGDGYQVTGDLTLHGVTKPVTIDFDHLEIDNVIRQFFHTLTPFVMF